MWFVLRWYGAEGLRAHVRTGVDLAARFADRVRADDRFELAAPHPFSLVCFRLRPRASSGTDAASGGPTHAADGYPAVLADGDAAVLAADAANAELLARVNATGRAYLTHTRLAGRHTLRLTVGSPQTTERHVAQTWQLIADTATALVSG